jgi:hypothetical protein
VGILVWLGMAPREALAAEASVELVLAPQSCVSELDLATAVGHRTRGMEVLPVAKLRPRARGVARYSVRVAAPVPGSSAERRAGAAGNEGAVQVTLEGEDDRGAFVPRIFEADSCDEATQAIALVLAIAHPSVDTASDSTSETIPPSPRAAATPATPKARGTLGTSVPSDAAKPAGSAPRTRAYLSLGASGRSLVEGQLVGQFTFGFRTEHAWLSWAEASAVVGVPRTIEGGGGQGVFTSYAARLVGAPGFSSVSFGKSVQLSTALGVEVGALTSQGQGPPKVQNPTRATMAVLVGARLHTTFGRFLFAELDAFGVGSILRDDFAFVNGGSTYRAPVLAFSLGANLGVTFP